jgi:mersacidin/lichenicidin family type 2 lantibiotic
MKRPGFGPQADRREQIQPLLIRSVPSEHAPDEIAAQLGGAMSSKNVIRSWGDYQYWLGLSEEERAALPTNPAGMLELADAELEKVVGADGSISCSCTGYSCGCTKSCGSTVYYSITVCCS